MAEGSHCKWYRQRRLTILYLEKCKPKKFAQTKAIVEFKLHDGHSCNLLENLLISKSKYIKTS
jgi:hypothetical protein